MNYEPTIAETSSESETPRADLVTRRYKVAIHLKPTEEFGPGFRIPQLDLTQLNAQQRAAVEYEGTHLLILAGAGTGKTRTLIFRAARFLGQARSNEVVLMTFTHEAADEMYRRLGQLLQRDLRGMWIGTIHSICRRLLKENATQLGYSPEFAIMDAEDSLELLKMCIPPRVGFVPATELARLMSFSRNALCPWQDLLGDVRFQVHAPIEIIARTIEQYQRRLRRSDRMDFDDLLTNTVHLLENSPDVRERYREQFKQILVDEYQDTSRIQAQILRLLAGEANVTVVGDDAQAIYGFRAATIDNMLNFEHDFVPATRVALEENYRSTPDILSLANANIAHNLRRLDKRLFTQRAPYAKPWICRCQNQDMEASFVVSRVIELYRKGIRLSEMVVLFRANFVRARLEMALNQAGIPYMVTGALRFFEQEHIKDILAYLRIAQNPDDLISLHRVFLCYPALNDTLFLKLEEASDRYKAPFLRVCQQISQGAEQDSVSGPVAILHTFAKDMAALVNEAAVLEGPARLIEWTVDRLYKPILQRRAPAEWRERLEDIAVLRDIAIRYTNVGEFMEQITLNKIDIHPRVERPAYQPDDMLKLATVHAAKGKEWQAVFLIGLFEGAFPVRKSLAVPDGEEEERRLFHVAVTRAKEELYLTVPELLMGKTGPYTGIASRFVVELPGEAYQDILVE